MFRILCDPSSGSVERASLKLLVIFLCAYSVFGSVIFWTCGVCAWCDELRTTSNFSEARSTLLEDGSQRIRNMSEFLIAF